MIVVTIFNDLIHLLLSRLHMIPNQTVRLSTQFLQFMVWSVASQTKIWHMQNLKITNFNFCNNIENLW